jgi:hypothetical protein
MKKVLIIAICILILMFACANCYALDNAGDDVSACFDIELVFARGSGATYTNSKEFLEVIKAADKLNANYRVSVLSHDLDYPAVEVTSPHRLLGAFVSAGKAYEFGASVQSGVTRLAAHYKMQHKRCPDMKFALIGYSQGAMVVSGAAKYLDADAIAFLMLIGDPETYLPEGKGLFPSACYGGALSSWRTFAPNCRTYKGSFG